MWQWVLWQGCGEDRLTKGRHLSGRTGPPLQGSNDQPRVRRKGHVSIFMKPPAKLGSQVPVQQRELTILVKWDTMNFELQRRERETFGGVGSEGCC